MSTVIFLTIELPI